MSKKYEKRVGEIVRTHLAMLIERRLNDPRVAGITVTDVEVTSDTRHAKVYYSLIGDEQARQQAASGLESASGWLRHELGQHLHTRHTPQLAFVYDPSLERGAHISDLLDSLKAREQAHGEHPEGLAGDGEKQTDDQTEGSTEQSGAQA